MAMNQPALPGIEREIARYIRVLAESKDRTPRAEDRGLYEKHLAAAAVFLAEFLESGSVAGVLSALQAEERAFGWSFLDGESGREAEAAFGRLLNVVRR